MAINIDFLIVGAGPVGLTLAAELKRRGVSSTTVDRLASGANTSRAAVIHARTLEMLEPLGITAELLRQGIKVPMFRVRDRDRPLINVDFRGIASRYPFTLMCPQDRTEQIILNTLERLGGGVNRGSELVDLELNPDGVIATLQRGDGQQLIHAKWIVGCDGMHSRVRELANISFEGAAYEENFVLADVHMEWPLSRDEVSLFFSPRGLVVVAPLPDERFRIVATAQEAPETPSAEFIQALLDERGPQKMHATVGKVEWSSRFRVHHRVASTFRSGRVLLCGDAAHVHSPAGGQGMNMGIRDSMTLAPLLDGPPAGLEVALDGWAVQRREEALAIVSLTDRMTKAATLKSPIARRFRNTALAFGGAFPFLPKLIARRLAGLG